MTTPITSTESTIYMTETDHQRLLTLLDQAVGAPDLRLRGDLRRLAQGVREARIVKPEAIPPDVVTMNSEVVVRDPDSGETDTWVITFPNEADVSRQRISVLSPLGSALLGRRKGETVEWSTGVGTGRVVITDITFQPEASGRFDL